MSLEQRRSFKWTNPNVWMRARKKLFGKETFTDQYMAFVGRGPEMVKIDLYLRQDLDLEGALLIQITVLDTESDPTHPSLDQFLTGIERDLHRRIPDLYGKDPRSDQGKRVPATRPRP